MSTIVAPVTETPLPDPSTEESRFIIITGTSGSGKSLALHIFEDLGYYCVDNLPPALLPQLAELREGEGSVACVVDVRAGDHLYQDLTPALNELEKRGVEATILFLDASDSTLVNRFKETRRKHPMMSRAGGILPSIQVERERLAELKAMAHRVIDTSEHTPRSLATAIGELFGEEIKQASLTVTVISFGFKHGLPLDADLVFDVRFLKNPHYVREMRWQDGRHQSVIDYIRTDPMTQPFLDRLQELVGFTMPAYAAEGKAYLTVAVGCTGGRHRSVYVAEALAEFLRERGWDPIVQHRDVKK